MTKPSKKPKSRAPSKRRYAQNPAKGQSPKSKGTRAKQPPSPALWLYGRHAVSAALKNDERAIRRVIATPAACKWALENGIDQALIAQFGQASPQEIDAALQDGAVHQGFAAEVDPLPRARLKDVCADPSPGQPVVVLDQLTDPQNIGAIFRSCAAFGARAIVTQERRTPALAGALAKAAVGAVDQVPCAQVVNIARAIEALQNLGYHCVGLAGDADISLPQLKSDKPIALVMGAEGAGLRPLVSQSCDQLVSIPMAPQMESLNVSVAAAISLYEVTQR